MSGMKSSAGLLLLLSLLQRGVRCEKNSLFVYSVRGGEVVLPCATLSQNCSSISWTFFKGGEVRFQHEVEGGRVRADSDRAGRMNVTSTCHLVLRDLVADDAGSYGCEMDKKSVTDVYLSLLDISSPSTVTELQPGRNLVLSCILFTYYDPGNCESHSSRSFDLRWLAEDGTQLSDGGRYKLTEDKPCNITLVVKLRTEDHNTRWRCQVITSSRTVSLDFKSSFYFLNTPSAQKPETPVNEPSPVQLPVSRIVLCVVLPLLVTFVGVFTCTLDHRRAKMSAAAFDLHQIK